MPKPINAQLHDVFVKSFKGSKSLLEVCQKFISITNAQEGTVVACHLQGKIIELLQEFASGDWLYEHLGNGEEPIGNEVEEPIAVSFDENGNAVREEPTSLSASNIKPVAKKEKTIKKRVPKEPKEQKPETDLSTLEVDTPVASDKPRFKFMVKVLVSAENEEQKEELVYFGDAEKDYAPEDDKKKMSYLHRTETTKNKEGQLVKDLKTSPTYWIRRHIYKETA